MADKKQSLFTMAAKGFDQLPLLRQVGLLLGLAGSIALGFSAVLWMQEPNFRPLFSNLSSADTTQVIDKLQQAGIQYKMSERDGAILVPGHQVHRARLKLAQFGISGQNKIGFALLEKNSGLGVSRFMENARYLRAVEGELAQTIGSIETIRSARVHLAVPRQSSFVSNNNKPSASVFVKLASGRTLEKDQISAIVHMVASSVPGLNPAAVTMTDQNGRLLTTDLNSDLARTKEQFAYQKQLQEYYERRIESMLAPMLGVNRVRARVHANIDFTYQEQTQEKYHPDEKILRSEHTVSENNNSSAGGGVPGALSNQASGGGVAAGGGKDSKSGSTRNRSVKNYEIGKSLRYIRSPSGVIRNLSVAVVVDDGSKIDGKSGKIIRIALGKKQIAKINDLVKRSIGYNEKRGDIVTIVNSSFVPPPDIPPLPAVSFWKQNWFWDLLKKGGAILIVLLLAFGLLKPLLSKLASKAKPGGEDDEDSSDPTTQILKQAELLKLKQQHLGSLKDLSSQDPSRVAGVLKNWVGND